jgi:hypothetical protein
LQLRHEPWKRRERLILDHFKSQPGKEASDGLVPAGELPGAQRPVRDGTVGHAHDGLGVVKGAVVVQQVPARRVEVVLLEEALPPQAVALGDRV